MASQPKILLVDDEEAITSNLAPFLERAGFTVEVAGDGEEALYVWDEAIGRGRQVLELAPLPGQEISRAADAPGLCPRCGGTLATDGGCLTCLLCGASGCE